MVHWTFTFPVNFPTSITAAGQEQDIINDNLRLTDGTQVLTPTIRMPYSRDYTINNILIYFETLISGTTISPVLILQNFRSGLMEAAPYQWYWMPNTALSTKDTYDISVFQQAATSPNYVTTITVPNSTFPTCQTATISPQITASSVGYNGTKDLYCLTATNALNVSISPVLSPTEIKALIVAQLLRWENSTVFPIKRNESDMSCVEVWKTHDAAFPNTPIIVICPDIQFDFPYGLSYSSISMFPKPDYASTSFARGQWTYGVTIPSWTYVWENNINLPFVESCMGNIQNIATDPCISLRSNPDNHNYYVPASIWIDSQNAGVWVKYINLQGVEETVDIEVGPSIIWANAMSMPTYDPLQDVARIITQIVSVLTYNAKTFPGYMSSPAPWSGPSPGNLLECRQSIIHSPAPGPSYLCNVGTCEQRPYGAAPFPNKGACESVCDVIVNAVWDIHGIQGTNDIDKVSTLQDLGSGIQIQLYKGSSDTIYADVYVNGVKTKIGPIQNGVPYVDPTGTIRITLGWAGDLDTLLSYPEEDSLPWWAYLIIGFIIFALLVGIGFAIFGKDTTGGYTRQSTKRK